MADAEAPARVSLREEVRSAFTALGDDEYRRWEESCRALEGPHEYPWAVPESRSLVAAVLGCIFGEDLTRADAPARTWAGTNTTMAVFTRRLGCLRELIGQEGVFHGPDATLRVHQIFDRVSIVATEAALAALTYSPAPTPAPAAAPAEAPSAAAPTEAPSAALFPTTASAPMTPQVAPPGTSPSPEFPGPTEQSAQADTVGVAMSDADGLTSADGSEADPSRDPVPGESSARGGRPVIRRRTVIVLLTAAVAAFVTSLAFALSSTPARQHTPRQSGGHPASTSGATVPTTRASVHTGTGSGTRSTGGGGPGIGTGGAAHGSNPAGSGAGGSGSAPIGQAPGSGSSGSNTPAGGSPGLTLPGGGAVTIPQVTVPGVTLPGGSTATTTNVTLPHQ